MKNRFLTVILALALCIGLAIPAFAADRVPTEEQAFQAMVALESQYPTWSLWTDDNYYKWKGGVFSGGYGCVGFAFMLSDAAFGDLPARKVTNFTFSDIRVGDILRIYNNTHSTIVLEVHDDYVVTADGNVAGFVFWGNQFPADTVLSADYLLTRYPVNNSVPVPESSSAPSFTDLLSWCEKEAVWAAQEGITNGYGAKGKFAPGVDCTQAQILTFLWRAENKPEAAAAPITVTASYQDAVNWAYEKGMIDDSFNPDAPCTRSQAVSYIWQAKGTPEAAEAAFFSDVDAGASYAGAVSWAVEKGITNGYGGNDTFAPNRVCSRGQIVCFLYRAYNN